MNQNLGLIGKKLGNTQIFNDDGTVSRVCAIQAGPCKVLAKRTTEKHGYAALQLGFGTAKANKPEAGYFEKLSQEPCEIVGEIRVSEDALAKFEVGQELKASDVFEVGQRVDVSGRSKGRGFTGVIKRHNFRGAGSVTHGTHEYKRHGGSIGTNMTPGRTLPNLRMPGHYGDERVSILNLRVARVLDAENIVLVEGAVPGPKRGTVTVRHAVKTPKA